MAKTKPKKPPKASANGVHPTPEVMTLAEAAAFLRVGENGLRADAEAGRIPAKRVAGEWRFTRQGLLDWFQEPTYMTPELSLIQKGVVVPGSNAGFLSSIGAFQDDETLEPMVEEIYRNRNRDIVGS